MIELLVAIRVNADGTIKNQATGPNLTHATVSKLGTGSYEIVFMDGATEYLVNVDEIQCLSCSRVGGHTDMDYDTVAHGGDPNNARVRVETFVGVAQADTEFCMQISRVA